MGLLDTLMGAVSGQGAQGGLGGTLLALLANESGRDGGQPAAGGQQSPGAVSGGLNELVERFEQNGLGDVVRSWIGTGQNQPVAPDELHRALGPQTVDRLSQQTGIDRNQLLPLLAKALPTIIDRLTPNGRVPDQHEIAQMQSNAPTNDTTDV